MIAFERREKKDCSMKYYQNDTVQNKISKYCRFNFFFYFHKRITVLSKQPTIFH